MDVNDEKKNVDDESAEDTTSKPVSDDTKNDEPKGELAELKAEIANLKGINKEVIASRDATKTKLKSFETAQEVKDLEEKGQYEEALGKEREKYDALQTELKDQAVTSSLREELQGTNALSVDTALELIDRSAIVYADGQVDKGTMVDAINTLKEKHSVLFGETKPAPTPKKAGEEKSQAGYAAELKKIQQNPKSTRKDLEQLRTKYGKQ